MNMNKAPEEKKENAQFLMKLAIFFSLVLSLVAVAKDIVDRHTLSKDACKLTIVASIKNGIVTTTISKEGSKEVCSAIASSVKTHDSDEIASGASAQ